MGQFPKKIFVMIFGWSWFVMQALLVSQRIRPSFLPIPYIFDVKNWDISCIVLLPKQLVLCWQTILQGEFWGRPIFASTTGKPRFGQQFLSMCRIDPPYMKEYLANVRLRVSDRFSFDFCWRFFCQHTAEVVNPASLPYRMLLPAIPFCPSQSHMQHGEGSLSRLLIPRINLYIPVCHV